MSKINYHKTTSSYGISTVPLVKVSPRTVNNNPGTNNKKLSVAEQMILDDDEEYVQLRQKITDLKKKAKGMGKTWPPDISESEDSMKMRLLGIKLRLLDK